MNEDKLKQWYEAFGVSADEFAAALRKLGQIGYEAEGDISTPQSGDLVTIGKDSQIYRLSDDGSYEPVPMWEIRLMRLKTRLMRLKDLIRDWLIVRFY